MQLAIQAAGYFLLGAVSFLAVFVPTFVVTTVLLRWARNYHRS